jgi:aryl-alcohol dehydrogenase-like predicted oxidoreductase
MAVKKQLARQIKGRRDEVFLASKVRPANFRKNKNEVIRACEGSLQRCTDYLDLYQLHWPNYTVPIAETMATMEQLAEQGKIRFIGVSNFSVDELRAAQRTLSNHRIVSNQVRYSLMERTIEDGPLEYCHNQGITIIAFSPFGTEFSSLLRA